MVAAVSAGHPATAEAGVEILAEGGSAADAAVAAALASCVAETVMTGLLGGGHAIYWDAAAGSARNLDCFCAVPGLGAGPRDTELLQLEVPFGEELVLSTMRSGLPAARSRGLRPASERSGSGTAACRGRGLSSPPSASPAAASRCPRLTPPAWRCSSRS